MSETETALPEIATSGTATPETATPEAAFTADERLVLQTAAHGVVGLMAAADPGLISSTRSGMAGGKALSSATGAIGRVLAQSPKGMELGGKSTADVADQVFTALTSSIALLKAKAPQEIDNFRDTIAVIMDAASRAHRGEAGPAEASMIRKITATLDAAA
ncbi:hypothetical protein [Streptomyces sp. NBC_01264]|uniref:hypothetical protein n=1 Tax=Streptomyces sp. NBC_01264 TaxID=2903804 RepID=UPI002259358C|nr:hypothetical protein [Streptomyces sp. NBC_01264]MCX4782713.1 hypothetical protein [Streptomyces sp. NBC_01264]